jgi:hypothetical protein
VREHSGKIGRSVCVQGSEELDPGLPPRLVGHVGRESIEPLKELLAVKADLGAEKRPGQEGDPFRVVAGN